MFAIVSPTHWDWVAIGTILLAIATFSLAVYNRKVVLVGQGEIDVSREGIELARQQNEMARSALNAQTVPVLANVPWGLDREVVWYNAASGEPSNYRDAAQVIVSTGTDADEPWVTISVPYRNVGNGVALITVVRIMIGGRLFDGQPRAPIVPPREISRAQLEVGRSSPAFDHALSLAVDGRDFAVVIGYADAAGDSSGAVSLDVHRERPADEQWRVRQLHLGPTPDDALDRPMFSSLPL